MKKKIICFELTMPNKGSRNGKRSGENERYFEFQTSTYNLEKVEKLLLEGKRSFFHNFGDGRGARILMSIIDNTEYKKLSKINSGFCGYERMISNILTHGKTKDDK